ncbi:MAG: TMEM165/GDT1 family protein [Candidatus Adiutrix sp.]|jgi:putative Ca2+/H+ antiporter (TMEM165/GDT1 family)|nr:TMEM165/GDT1 family protein [Candidatus Adiutrix sp.]
MRLKALFPVFSGIFLAELGDKTQISAVLFSASGAATALEVFLAASLALLASTALAVLGGAALSRALSPASLKTMAGLVFLILGGYYILQALGLTWT